MQYSIIGSGNLANSLAKAMLDAGHSPKFIHSRNSKTALKLSTKYKLTFCDDLNKVKHKGIIIIAVNDDQIKSVAKKLPLSAAIVIHTSGSVPIRALGTLRKKRGVLYPLQSFRSKRAVSFKGVPVCIEGSDKSTTRILTNIASSLSDSILQIDSKKRKQIHLAAVMANNFSNHLLQLSFEHLHQNDIDPKILYPLVRSTFKKALSDDPASLQTGPAVRNDRQVIEEHLRLLDKDRSAQRIYKAISESISIKSKK